MHQKLAIALCHAQRHEFDIVALCFQLPTDGTLPEWVELIPAPDSVTKTVTGRDGREWLNDQPDAVVAALQGEVRAGRDLVLDWEHSTELKAPKGEQAPAAGWFKEFRNRNGVIEGKLELNTSGKSSVENKEYRYLSPALIYRKDNHRIVSIASVGLTNKHNLHLQALNHEQRLNGEPPMLQELLKLLGLDDNTDEKAALNSVQKLQSDLAAVTVDRDKLKSDLQTALNNTQPPSLEKFVPRGDYDAVLARANNAEQKLKERDEQDHDAEIETAINTALRAGQITPGSKDFYIATCKQEGGLEKFSEFLKTAPKICEPTNLPERGHPGGSGTALNSDAQDIANTFGNSAEDLKKYAGEPAH